jgi:hypothetical protein
MSALAWFKPRKGTFNPKLAFTIMWQEVYHNRLVLVEELSSKLLAPFKRRGPVQIEVTVLLRERVVSENVPVVRKLRQLGLTVERVLPRLSMISGRTERSKISAMEALPEVKAVRVAGLFHVDPIEDR